MPLVLDYETSNVMRIRGWPRNDAVAQSPACDAWTLLRNARLHSPQQLECYRSSDARRGKNVYMKRYKLRGQFRELALVVFVEAHNVLHRLAIDPAELAHPMDKRLDVGHCCCRRPTH